MLSSEYRYLLQKSNPVGLWPMDERVLGDARDISGNGFTLTYGSQGKLFTEAAPGGMFASLGSDVTFKNNIRWSQSDTAFRLATGFSMGGWFKSDGAWGSDRGFIANWNANGYMIYNAPGMRAYHGGSFITLTNEQTATEDDIWHHFMLTHDGVTYRYYRDGRDLFNTASGGSTPTSNLTICSYNSGAPNGGLGGAVAWAGYWDKVLGPGEVYEFYRQGLPEFGQKLRRLV